MGQGYCGPTNYSARCDGDGELREKVIGRLSCRTVDKTLPELRQLAPNLSLHIIGQERAPIFVAQRHLGAALRETGHASLPFPGNAIAVRRIQIRESHLSFPPRFDRSDLHGGDGLELVFRNLVELLAAWDATLEHFGVVEFCPDDLPGGRKLDLAIHGHRHARFSTCQCLDIEVYWPGRKALSSSYLTYRPDVVAGVGDPLLGG